MEIINPAEYQNKFLNSKFCAFLSKKKTRLIL